MALPLQHDNCGNVHAGGTQLSAAKVARVVRLARIFRIFKAGSCYKQLHLISTVLVDSREVLAMLLVLLMLIGMLFCCRAAVPVWAVTCNAYTSSSAIERCN